MDRGHIVEAFNLYNDLEQKQGEQRRLIERLADLPVEIDAIERRLNALGLPALPKPFGAAMPSSKND